MHQGKQDKSQGEGIILRASKEKSKKARGRTTKLTTDIECDGARGGLSDAKNGLQGIGHCEVLGSAGGARASQATPSAKQTLASVELELAEGDVKVLGSDAQRARDMQGVGDMLGDLGPCGKLGGASSGDDVIGLCNGLGIGGDDTHIRAGGGDCAVTWATP
ncbi:unnamed protein product [Ilex paraguariensis]|uniref:Uncharacterized protein n=1 Tax=Ilex paraguariensis TaxID=185542 RepID=A0ABC8RHA8_9AQUA